MISICIFFQSVQIRKRQTVGEYMNKFIYEGFACTEANDEQIIFSNGRGEVRLENFNFDCIPMKKYKFSFEENENGKWKINAFEKNKFNEFSINEFSIFMVGEPKGKICVTMRLDAYKEEDMIYFKRGTRFNLKIE